MNERFDIAAATKQATLLYVEMRDLLWRSRAVLSRNRLAELTEASETWGSALAKLEEERSAGLRTPTMREFDELMRQPIPMPADVSPKPSPPRTEP